MERSTISTLGCGVKLVARGPKLSKLGGELLLGCFSASCSRTVWEWPKGLGLVSALHAAAKPPSWHCLMHLCCFVASLAVSEVCLCLGGLQRGRSAQSSAFSPSNQRFRRERVQARRWFLCALPPRGKGQSTVFESIWNSTHDSVSFCQAVVAAALLTHRAHKGRNSFGMCFSVGTKRE
jgi:hypothetical protein